MNNLSRLIEVSKYCSVLLIDNDIKTINHLEELLSGFFKSVVVSSEREEALTKFRENRFDVVIVSEKLNGFSGVEILKEIRRENREIPILMITDFEDKESLTESYNQGVTHFIKRSSLTESILNTLSIVIKIIAFENIELIRRETETLKCKERELSIQQKLAFKKQQYVIRDDFYYKKLDYEDEGRTETWFINLRYIPFHILSGDFYSIRRIGQGKVLFYLSDAMGKGLSAFLTSSIVTSFFNYLVDRAVEEENFDLDKFCNQFIDYSKKHLSEEEALCVLFVLLDLRENKLHVVNFSMPPLFVEIGQKSIIRINTKNLPIIRFTSQYKKETLDITGARKILICSDGLYHTSYMRSIERDFLESPLRSDLYGKFREQVNDIDDDITFIFVKKFDNSFVWKEEYLIDGKLSEINRVVAEVELSLSIKGYDPILIVEFINALSEILMNAYEHGCLGIGGKRKQKLLKKGYYEEHLIELEKTINKKIQIEIGEFEESGKNFLVFTVQDEGEGFDTTLIKETVRNIELLHSRGIAMVKGLVDEIYYNDRGNQVTVIKRIKRE